MGALPVSTVFTIRGPLDLADLHGLCKRLRAALKESGAVVALCDVDGLVEPDLLTVEALARLELAARRIGCDVRLRNAPEELYGLVAFIGLDGVIPRVELRIEAKRQAEQREELLGVQEERELDDPAG